MSVTVQTICQEQSAAATIKDVNEFYMPTILSFNLKKTSEERLPMVDTENISSRQNGEVIEETKGMSEMSPRKSGNYTRNQTSSFLLEPYLQPVAPYIESSKENPVLKALFGGKNPPGLSPWTYIAKTSLNNYHPFKKTELSQDLNSDETPIQIPKALAKKRPRSRKKSPPKREPSPVERKTTVLKKEVRSSTDATSPPVGSSPSFRLCESNTRIKSLPPERTLTEYFLNKKKKVASSSLLSVKPRVQYVNSDRLIELRTLVDKAIKNHKVYSMTGCYNSVRNALKQRGWIEKIDSEIKGRRRVNRFEEIGLYDAAFQFVQKYQTVAAMRLSVQMNSGFVHNDQIHYTGQGEAEIINRMLKNVTEDLCWLSRPYPYYCWKDFDKFEMINRLPKAFFSNKVGLCNSLRQIQWFYEDGVCSTQFPRTYNTSLKDELDAFKEDYRMTACIGTLKWFLLNYKNGGEPAVRSPEGKVDMNVIEFALRRCAEFVKTKQHQDIDISDPPVIWDYQWDQFITQYYKLINDGQILKEEKEDVTIKAIASNVQSMLNILKPYWPQFDIDGYQNYWIVKPGGRCCGAGIVIKNNLEQIMVIVNPNSLKETRYVIQKYIERPLLIYNTKFDIRQWFLVTNVYPLTVWMYKESYLRFCSQPFTLKNTHESIHLCNNAVQKKYKNGKRDKGLPDENMWDCYTFQTYLKAIGHPEAWDKYIYPGMREGFIGALLASQDTMERKKNCFELYGADFMISDTLTDGPWLIEINSNPAMDASTSITARMCPQVLEDIVKVVIDRRDNKNASTGAFEMIFRQNCPPIPPYLGMTLCVKGRKAFRSPGENKTISKKSKIKDSSENLDYTDTEEESIGEEIVSVNNSPENPSSIRDAYSLEEKCSEQVSNKSTAENKDIEKMKKDTDNRKKKIDWVRKNIEDLKNFYEIKKPKSSSSSKIFSTDLMETLNNLEREKKNEEEIEEKENLSKYDSSTRIIIESCNAILKNYDISNDTRKHFEKLLEICKKTNKSTPSRILAEELLKKDSECSSGKKKNEKSENKNVGADSDDSIQTFVSASSIVSKTNFKDSADQFCYWKSNLTETHRICKDMINKLQLFQEENSKVKFQKALKKRMKDEVDFISRIREDGKSKKLRKGKALRREQQEGLEKDKVEDGGSTWKNWDGDGFGGLTPLAINSATGAVRPINDTLPKIRQRSRPLLPNGSSGHGRKIDVALE